MRRRTFISESTLVAAGWMAAGPVNLLAGSKQVTGAIRSKSGLYELFRNPASHYRPFVRWWWNGNKVEAAELIRELRLLKEAGVGGVEINPVQFPSRFEGDDIGKPSLMWLSDEWIEMLQVVFGEAKELDMTCDLIVGSGWPFGAENLPEAEQARIVVIGVKKLSGPLDYSISRDELFMEADPAVSSPWAGRRYKLLSLVLVPDPVSDMEEITDLSDRKEDQFFNLFIPGGDHALIALIEITGFMEVINGAPGASGPVLDHYNKAAVKKYLNRMSDTIESVTGPLADYLRSLFTDSMELEGSNWTGDMRDEFIRRRGYDLLPFLPFLLFKTGAMGNVTDFHYGVAEEAGFEEMIRGIRYDFETTKAEMLEERFLKTFASWCRENGVKSRMQAYGRGFFPLESSMTVDIPEGESWTMNWLKHRIGEEMPESDYRRGRAYTMINKYVSSAAHLTGRRVVSCEEMTDTYTVFNTSLENLKIGSDQSIISGVTHSIFHGFNYSPPEAPYPGWIRYGGYFNEQNTWWPHFHLLNEYKARLSALLQNSEMYADIAILPPTADMWRLIGMQNEPFPSVLHAEYLSLVWEAMVKNGSGCDYISERILESAKCERGYLLYGSRRYHTIFLVQVDTITPATADRLLEFIASGGRVFCIGTVPSKYPGWNDHNERDEAVASAVRKMKTYPERFILLKKPEKDFIGWYGTVIKQYAINSYMSIENPGPYLMQTRYRSDTGSEYIFIVNSSIQNSHQTRIAFSRTVCHSKQCSLWNPETGNRMKVELDTEGGINLNLGPAESLLFAFDQGKPESEWKPLPTTGNDAHEVAEGWRAEFRHCRGGSPEEVFIDRLNDLKEMPDFVYFSGTIIYRNTFRCDTDEGIVLNLGKVYGTAELIINDKSCGVKWYGHKIFDISEYLKQGENSLEVKVTTSMGNYMKSLADNPTAQYWTNAGSKNQPLQSMGMIGPVSYYKK
ncbi:MAG: glycosyl hydrolase [Bacteroidales bacterium]|jgi:hypothetical protein|nr:glycosyl hydrolase [Bacteroidales bacterium]